MIGLKRAEDNTVLRCHRACITALRGVLTVELRAEVTALRDALERVILAGEDGAACASIVAAGVDFPDLVS